jgi:hypothetical protein
MTRHTSWFKLRGLKARKINYAKHRMYLFHLQAVAKANLDLWA